MNKLSKDEIFRQGQRAYDLGDSRNANPYEKDSENWKQWDNGWNDAQQWESDFNDDRFGDGYEDYYDNPHE